MHRFKDILFVVTSDAKHSDAAFEKALILAENNQARLTVVKVVDKLYDNIELPRGSFSPNELQIKIVDNYKEKLEEMIIPIRKSVDIRTKVLIGISFMEITREVLREKYDLVIKAAQNDDVGLPRIFGSDDMNLLRKCPCPLLLIRPRAEKNYRRIVAAVDINDFYLDSEIKTRYSLNIKILELASSMALSESAELYIVHAWEAVAEGMMKSGFMRSSDEEVAAYIEKVIQHNVKEMDNLVNKISEKLGSDATEYIRPIKKMLKGSPRKVIPEYVNNVEADLVVMGTVGRTGIPGFIIGNTAETILNHINCSVFAVKPEGFKTSITLD